MVHKHSTVVLTGGLPWHLQHAKTACAHAGCGECQSKSGAAGAASMPEATARGTASTGVSKGDRGHWQSQDSTCLRLVMCVQLVCVGVVTDLSGRQVLQCLHFPVKV